ncbi:MAG: hypothetical protein H6922_06355 [Pseudomonadaceae bacterium]|nr:hypothetical protein [Pseudomonadaceae bacterium]
MSLKHALTAATAISLVGAAPVTAQHQAKPAMPSHECGFNATMKEVAERQGNTREALRRGRLLIDGRCVYGLRFNTREASKSR